MMRLSEVTCNCGRSTHIHLDCGVPLPSPRERLIAENIRDALEVYKVLKGLMATHGMHGPCRHNACSSCDRAYKRALAIVRAVEGHKE